MAIRSVATIPVLLRNLFEFPAEFIRLSAAASTHIYTHTTFAAAQPDEPAYGPARIGLHAADSNRRRALGYYHKKYF